MSDKLSVDAVQELLWEACFIRLKGEWYEVTGNFTNHATIRNRKSGEEQAVYFSEWAENMPEYVEFFTLTKIYPKKEI